MGMGMGGMGMMNPMMMGMMNPMMMGMMGHHGMMGMHGMHHMMHGMHHMMNPMMMGMGGMGMMNPMMGGMGMMGGYGQHIHHHHHGRGRHSMSSSSDSSDGGPQIVVNDMSSRSSHKKKKRRIRRLQEIQDVQEVDVMDYDLMPLTPVTVEKCVWSQREVVCIRYGEESESSDYAVTIEVEYASMDLVDSVEDKESNLVESGYHGQQNGEMYDTNEWTIEDMEAHNAQIYECHDNFDLFEEVCIEKWQLQEEEVTVLLKGGENGDLEYVLTEKKGWNEVVVLANGGGNGNGMEKVRVCRQILVDCTLCVEMTVDVVTENIAQILKVAISSPAVNGLP